MAVFFTAIKKEEILFSKYPSRSKIDTTLQPEV